MGPLSPPVARSWGPQNGVPETTVESLVNKCLFDSDKGTQVWKKRRTVAPDPGENYFENAMAMLQSQVELYQLETKYWTELALKQDEEITDLKIEVEEVRGELRQLGNMKCLQTEKWRKEALTLALELKLKNEELAAIRNFGTEDWRKEAMTLVSELKVRRREMKAWREFAKSEKLHMEEAHKLEFESLRLKARRVIELLKASFENDRTAAGDAETARESQLEVELPGPHMRPMESTGGSEQSNKRGFLEAMEQYFDAVCKRREFLEAVEQYYDAKIKATRIGEAN